VWPFPELPQPDAPLTAECPYPAQDAEREFPLPVVVREGHLVTTWALKLGPKVEQPGP
jgi:hypothetical protein